MEFTCESHIRISFSYYLMFQDLKLKQTLEILSIGVYTHKFPIKFKDSVESYIHQVGRMISRSISLSAISSARVSPGAHPAKRLIGGGRHVDNSRVIAQHKEAQYLKSEKRSEHEKLIM